MLEDGNANSNVLTTSNSAEQLLLNQLNDSGKILESASNAFKQEDIADNEESATKENEDSLKNANNSSQIIPDILFNAVSTPSQTVIELQEAEYLKELALKQETLRQSLSDPTKLPESYSSPSEKERRILEYVGNFERQYKQLYPERKQLLLCPENEVQVQKCICTTIRPSQMSYKELNDYRGCTKFVADWLSYKPLNPPYELPKKVPSPAFTLKLQSGNSFVYSLLLTSLLLGVGYNAYIVSGYAVKEVTLMDETKKYNAQAEERRIYDKADDTSSLNTSSIAISTTLGASEISRNVESSSSANRYQVKKAIQLKSTFEERQTAKAKELQQRRENTLKLKESVVDENHIETEEDDLKGLRVHAWVLVMPGKRDVAEPFFIEPTIGRICSVEHEDYLGVESVFSSTNYWVNMQTCFDGLKGISFDLANNVEWEFLFLANSIPIGTSTKRQENFDGVSSSDLSGKNNENNLLDECSDDESPLNQIEMPRSWVEKLNVSLEDYTKGGNDVRGGRLTTYKNCEQELFGAYFRRDGLIERLKLHENSFKNAPAEIHEFFCSRRDRLEKRIRISSQGKIYCFFGQGRSHALKEHLLLNGATKELNFYDEARFDGLVRREEHDLKTIEYFRGRDDGLVYRSIKYDTQNIIEESDADSQEPSDVVKMTQKFEKKDNTDYAKITYYLQRQKIRVTYHPKPDSIFPASREFYKPSADPKGSILDVSKSFESDPFAKAFKRHHIQSQLLALLKAESSCLNAIKLAKREIDELLNIREQEENEITLMVSIYDTVRNSLNMNGESKKEASRKTDNSTKKLQLDAFSPFLINVADVDHPTREEILTARDACLKSYKERLIDKINIIQIRHDEEMIVYQKKQHDYNKNQDNMTYDEHEEYRKWCQQALFRMQILEKRLNRHKEIAPDKFMSFSKFLQAKVTQMLISNSSNSVSISGNAVCSAIDNNSNTNISFHNGSPSLVNVPKINNRKKLPSADKTVVRAPQTIVA